MLGFSVMNGTEGEEKCHSYAGEISRRMHPTKTKEATFRRPLALHDKERLVRRCRCGSNHGLNKLQAVRRAESRNVVPSRGGRK